MSKEIELTGSEQAAAEGFYDKRRAWEADIPSQEKFDEMNQSYTLMWTIARAGIGDAQQKVIAMLRHIRLYREETSR